MKNNLIIVVVTVLVFVAGFAANAWLVKGVPAGDPCDLSVLRNTIAPFDSLLRAFDDTSVVALNLPRNAVTDPTLRLQEYRRDVQDLEAPVCVATLKQDMLSYMDTVINTLVGFIGGVTPAQAQASLEGAVPFRTRLEEQLGQLLEATITPSATLLQQASIPVTGNSQVANATPSPSITPVPLGSVQNPKGANVRFGPGVDYSFQYILEEGAAVELIGRSEDGQWILVRVPDRQEVTGWILAPLLSTDIDPGSLPVFTETVP